MSDEMTNEDVKKIHPRNKHVLVMPPAAREKTQGGIYLPEAQKTGAHTNGEVIAWCPTIDNRKLGLTVGMKVIFNKFSYTEIKVPSKKQSGVDMLLLMIEEKNIQGIIA